MMGTVPFWGLHKKEYSKEYNIWESVLGSPYFGKVPYGVLGCHPNDGASNAKGMKNQLYRRFLTEVGPIWLR